MDVLSSADESNGGHAKPVGACPLLHSLEYLRVVGQAEIVIGAEVDVRALQGVDLRPLGRADDLLVLVQAGIPDFLEPSFKLGPYLCVAH